jgi:hypothetical protein
VTKQIIRLNPLGGTCHDRLLPRIAATRPDVPCLQEVIQSSVSAPDWLTYRDGDQDLPDRVAAFRPAAEGELWDHDRFLTVPDMHDLRDPRGRTDTPGRSARAKRFRRLPDQISASGEVQVLC